MNEKEISEQGIHCDIVHKFESSDMSSESSGNDSITNVKSLFL